MMTKLRVIAFLSVVVLISTFFWSTREIEQMFAFGSLEVNQVSGEELDRKRGDSFSAKGILLASEKREQAESERLIKEIREIEASFKNINQTCQRDVEKLFAGKDLIDPNGEFYKEIKNIHSGLKKTTIIVYENSKKITNLKYKIDSLIRSEKIKKVEIKKLVNILGTHADICNSQELENFVMTSLESLSLRSWPANSRKIIQKDLKGFSKAFLSLQGFVQPIYRGVGIIKVAIHYGAFENFDSDYIDEMHFLLEERRDELQYQFQNLSDVERMSEYLIEEFEWRDDFAKEMSEYLRQNDLEV